jgi:hypothetical protein
MTNEYKYYLIFYMSSNLCENNFKIANKLKFKVYPALMRGSLVETKTHVGLVAMPGGNSAAASREGHPKMAFTSCPRSIDDDEDQKGHPLVLHLPPIATYS